MSFSYLPRVMFMTGIIHILVVGACARGCGERGGELAEHPGGPAQRALRRTAGGGWPFFVFVFSLAILGGKWQATSG